MALGDRLVWVDIETFGLNVRKDPILEVGFRITDLDLNTIDDYATQVWESDGYDVRFAQMKANPDQSFVRQMHEKSGLWKDCEEYGLMISEAQAELAHFLDGHGITGQEPMCGSSVHFDREMLTYWMPNVAKKFLYRNIDNSTLKELVKRYNPELARKLEQEVQPQKRHRVLDDLADTINEFRLYRDNFLWLDQYYE